MINTKQTLKEIFGKYPNDDEIQEIYSSIIKDKAEIELKNILKDFAEIIKKIELSSGKSFESLLIDRKEENVAWRVIFSEEAVKKRSFQGINERIATILKRDRCAVVHYLNYYKKPEAYFEKRRLYESNL